MKAPARATVVSVALFVVIATILPQIEPFPAAQDADGTSADRRKKFEEEKRRLENEGTLTEVPSDPEQSFFVSPARATMLVGEAWLFSSFDIHAKTLTAESEWSTSSASVADVSTDHTGLITATAPGTAIIRARTGGRYAEATVTVLSGDKLPALTIRWLAPQIPGFTIKKMFPSLPNPSGVVVTFFEQNAQGEALVRAFTSNGRQVWMKRGKDLSPRNGKHRSEVNEERRMNLSRPCL